MRAGSKARARRYREPGNTDVVSNIGCLRALVASAQRQQRTRIMMPDLGESRGESPPRISSAFDPAIGAPPGCERDPAAVAQWLALAPRRSVRLCGTVCGDPLVHGSARVVILLAKRCVKECVHL